MKRAAAGLLLGLLVGLGAIGCDRAQRVEPLPEGFVLVGERAAFARLLDHFRKLEGTPLARISESVADAIPNCQELEAVVPSGEISELAGRLQCATHAARMESMRTLRDEFAIAFALPSAAGLRIRGGIAVGTDGGLRFGFDIPDAGLPAFADLLLPSDELPGPPILSSTDTLVHARARPRGGLDLAALVPHASQADRLFRLKSALFAGAVLDGTWELASYVPQPGDRMALSALAVGFTLRTAAVSAMESFVDELRTTWGVARSDFSAGRFEGACLAQLNLLPELAPCYVATDRALVIGWNETAIRKALDGTRAHGPRDEGEVLIHLARFAKADARLIETLPGGATSPGVEYPWKEMAAIARRTHLGFRVDAQLRPRDPS